MPTDKAQNKTDTKADWVLVTLIIAAEKGVEVGVTLTTAAGLVTGTIIGGAKYMEMQKRLSLKRQAVEAQCLKRYSMIGAPFISSRAIARIVALKFPSFTCKMRD